MTKHVQPRSPTSPLLTLDELAKKLPSPEGSVRDALASDPEARAELVALGRKIKTSRIVIDEQRLFNQAFQFYEVATPEQRRKLVGFTPALLALAVGEALRDEALASSVAANVQHAGVASAGTKAEAARAHAEALALRDQAVGVLESVAGRSRRELDTIDAAHVSADLATALGELAKLAASMVKDEKRASLFGLTPDFAAELREAQSSVAAASAAHVGRAPAGGDQAALDLEDGLSLHLLGAIVTAFEGAHDRDATIPRLVPIATRRLIGAHSHGARDAAPAPEAPPGAALSP